MQQNREGALNPEDPKSKLVVHLYGCGCLGEYTACGYSFDSWLFSDLPFTPTSKAITCPNCLKEIDFYKRVNLKGLE